MNQAFEVPLSKPLGFLLGAALALPASANPQGASVVHGSAHFAHPSANTLEVTNSDRAIINWRSFSIDQGETTRFVQPSPQSAVLNRVTGADPSSIYGQLDSNGRVFLINQHGILVGESGVINTAGFVGSTLDIADRDFLDNQLNFAGQSGASILNEGFIASGAGGEIVLVSPDIENRGTLSAENGRIVLAAGERVRLSSADFENIHFEVQAPENKVLNLGEMIAGGGSVGVFAGSIRHDGVIEAGGVDTDAAGNIVLRAQSDINVGTGARVQASGANGGAITLQSEGGDTVVSGTVEAVGTDGTGGDIRILGERVGLFGSATVDASGRYGGGQVLAGGDFQGKGEVQTASQTQLNPDAAIHVDALESGDGGRAIVWADGFTATYGTVSARGGSVSGNGGFVEISGKEDLLFRGRVDTRAPNGATGTALFDPRNIMIDGSTQAAVFVDDLFADSVGATATFGTEGTDGLNSLLDSTDVVLQANNDIEISAADIIGNDGNSLTLQAGRSIIMVNGPVSIQTNGGDVTLQANSTVADGVQSADRLAGPGNIVIGDGVQSSFISSAGGHITLEIRDGFEAGNIQLNDVATVASGGGDIAFHADNGIIVNPGGSINAGLGSVFLKPYSSGATIDLGAPGGGDQVIDATVIGAITANELVIGGATTGDIVVQNTFSTGTPNVTIETAGELVFNQGSQLGIDALSAAQLTVNAGGIAGGGGFPDFLGGTGGTLNMNTENGINVITDFENIAFNNTAGGNVDILSISANPTHIQNSINSGGGATAITQDTAGLVIDGSISHSSPSALLTLNALGITNDGSIAGGGGGIVLGPSTSGSITVTNNGTISDSGGIFIDTNGVGGTFVNGTAGAMSTADGADIIIESDAFDLQGGSIDAGANRKTILRRATTGSWTLGGGDYDLGSAELDTILNNIGIGDATGTITTATFQDEVVLTNGQNLGIHTTTNIDFNQAAGTTAISGANGVSLDTGSINNFTVGNIDVDASFLGVNVMNGIAEAASPLDTRVGLLDMVTTGTGGLYVSNTGALQVDRANAPGAISIANTGGDLTVRANGVQSWGTDASGTIDLVNTGDSIIVDSLVWSNGGDITLWADGATSDILVNTGVLIIDGDLQFDTGVLAETANVTLNAGRNVTVSGASGALTDGATAVGAMNGLLTVNAGNALTVQGGSGAEQRARLSALNMNITTGGNLSVLGGSANDTAAGINVIDSLYANVGGDLRLIGGSGALAQAIIGDENGSPITLQYDIAGNLRMTGGTGAGAAAGMGSASGPASIDIGFNQAIGGSVIMTAGSGGEAIASAPGAIAAIGTVGTGDADITIRAAGSLTMTSNAGSGDMALIGSPEAGGSVDIAVGIGGGGNLNINTGHISSGLVRLDAFTEAGTAGNIVLNGGVVAADRLIATTSGRFEMRGGLLDIGGPSSLGARFDMAGGIAVYHGAVAVDGVYTQSGGITGLDNGRLDVATRYDLHGGRLMGNGVVATALLNNAGGTIAPGAPEFAGDTGALSPDELVSLAESAGGIGTLRIDGDLTMGAAGKIRLDLAGADTDTRQAGILYDFLRVTGNARLDGELEMVVNVLDYPGSPGDRYRPFAFGGVQGGFDSITGLPPGYTFQRDPTATAIAYVMTGTPWSRRLTDLITEDEIDTLNRNVRDRLEDMIRLQELRRREAMADEEGEMSEDEKKKRLLVCS